MSRATSYRRAAEAGGTPFDVAVLAHDERHFRRRLLTLKGGTEVLVDLPAAIAFETGDVLVLDDGRLAGIVAAEEDLFEVTGTSPHHLLELAWHLGNRHLPARLEEQRILIKRDHVIKDMLIGLGAGVHDVRAPFVPVRGAYHQHGDAHSHSHAKTHHHDH